VRLNNITDPVIRQEQALNVLRSGDAGSGKDELGGWPWRA